MIGLAINLWQAILGGTVGAALGGDRPPNVELREDGSVELREDGTLELRE